MGLLANLGFLWVSTLPYLARAPRHGDNAHAGPACSALDVQAGRSMPTGRHGLSVAQLVWAGNGRGNGIPHCLPPPCPPPAAREPELREGGLFACEQDLGRPACQVRTHTAPAPRTAPSYPCCKGGRHPAPPVPARQPACCWASLAAATLDVCTPTPTHLAVSWPGGSTGRWSSSPGPTRRAPAARAVKKAQHERERDRGCLGLSSNGRHVGAVATVSGHSPVGWQRAKPALRARSRHQPTTTVGAGPDLAHRG
jgi:hypothetical protein